MYRPGLYIYTEVQDELVWFNNDSEDRRIVTRVKQGDLITIVSPEHTCGYEVRFTMYMVLVGGIVGWMTSNALDGGNIRRVK